MAAESLLDASVVVVGAGVVGLTTAMQLAEKGYKSVTVLAKHMPGDNHSEYTSIWAGVNWVPVSKEGTEEAQWDIETWDKMKKLADEKPEAGIWIRDKTVYYRNQDKTPDHFHMWFKNIVPDFRFLTKEEIPPYADWGVFYKTIGLDPCLYLHYLQARCLSMGVVFRRGSLDHIRDAFTFDKAVQPDLVVNCTGLGSAKLGGVMDEHLKPMRGQLVVVENESQGQYGISSDDEMQGHIGECCYIIDRPSGGGTVLGGSYYLDWSTEPDMVLAERIMKRSIKVCPHLVPPGCGIEALRVIRHQVGLRPFRHGGPRIEKESIQDQAIGRLNVVHCYGAGGFGFQSSFGMASKAVRLVEEMVSVRAVL